MLNHQTRPTRQTRHRAFTLVELLVVIAIIGVLIGLLLPGVQSLREASRRSGCVQRLTTLCLATASYHSRWDQLPVGTMAPSGPIRNEIPTSSADVPIHQNWLGALLFELDESVMAKHLDRSISVYAEANSPVTSLNYGVVQCPCNYGLAHNSSSYAGVHHDVAGPINEDNHGVFILNVPIAYRDITDGLSHTLMFGEKVSHPDDDLGWLSGTRSSLRNTGSDLYKGTVSNAADFQPLVPDDAEKSVLAVGGFSSQHVGGVHFATVIGETQFRSNEVDMEILRQMAHREDGKLPIQWQARQ